MNVRTLLIVLLGGALVYGAFFLEPSENHFDPEAEVSALTDRVEDYRVLRFGDRWLEMYETMLVPAHREVATPEEFVKMYGSGIMKPHQLELVDLSIDPDSRTADVTLRLTAELVPDLMPAGFRKGFQMPENPEDLRSTETFPMRWIWQEGEWYWPLDPQELEVLKRARAKDGGVTIGGGSR